MPDGRTTKKSGAAPGAGRKTPATKISANRASASTKGAASKKVAAQSSKHAHRKEAVGGSRTRTTLEDIHARGEELTSEINELLLRLR